MSKKKLLSENQIRRFMGLAGISSLSSGFISRGTNMSVLREAPEDEDLGLEAEDEDADPVGDPVEDELPVEEPDMGGAEYSAEQVEDALLSAMQAMEASLESDLDIEMSVEGDEELEAPAEEEPAMDDMADMDLGAEEDELAAGMSGMYEEIEVVDTDAIVREVYRRVAKRLYTMVKKNK